MRKILMVAAAALATAVPAAAEAAVFVFSGTFTPATGASFTTLLGSGSFDGYFNADANAFSQTETTFISAFSVNLRNKSGDILKTLTQNVDGASAYVSPDYVSYYGGTIVNFQDRGSNYLQLVVPTNFSGRGAVLANGSSYAQIAPQNQATVAAGTITALPEAGTWAMMIAGFGLTGAALRRRPISAARSMRATS